MILVSVATAIGAEIDVALGVLQAGEGMLLLVEIRGEEGYCLRR